MSLHVYKSDLLAPALARAKQRTYPTGLLDWWINSDTQARLDRRLLARDLPPASSAEVDR